MVAPKVASHLNFGRNREYPFLCPFSCPRPRRPQLFFFVHLSFTESQINSVFDVRGCPRGQVGGTLAWRATQIEGPVCSRTPRRVRAVPTLGLLPGGDRYAFAAAAQ